MATSLPAGCRLLRPTARCLTGPITDDPEWPSLVDRVRGLALAGHEVEVLIGTAVRMRPFDGARSAAAVLHWRLGQLTGGAVVQGGEALYWIPESHSPHAAVARQAADLIADRWQEIRRTVRGMGGPLAWAPSLGVKPTDRNEAAYWAEAVTAVWAYREQYAVPDHVLLLGERPSDIRPDARAAYDFARSAADRHLARRFHNLTPDELADLASRQQAILDARPEFDPFELEEARRALDRADRTARPAAGADRRGGLDRRRAAPRRLAILEAQSSAYERWRREVASAKDALRQIDWLVRHGHGATYGSRR